MASAKDDSLQAIGVKLNGNNYVYWAYVMKNCLIGKGLWGYVSGMISIPNNPKDEKHVELVAAWEMNNSKIITWINNSVDLAIGMQLAKFSTSKEVWDHLAKLYTKANFAKRYQLEMEIRTIQQGDKSIQVFYNELTNLWDQLALTEPEELGIVKLYFKYREEQRLVQFLCLFGMSSRHSVAPSFIELLFHLLILFLMSYKQKKFVCSRIGSLHRHQILQHLLRQGLVGLLWMSVLIVKGKGIGNPNVLSCLSNMNFHRKEEQLLFCILELIQNLNLGRMIGHGSLKLASALTWLCFEVGIGISMVVFFRIGIGTGIWSLASTSTLANPCCVPP